MSLSLAVMICCMLFLRKGQDAVPSLIILCWYAATKIFLLGLFFPVTLCFLWGKWASQVANEIAHLVEVIASLSVWHDDETKHFFTGQSGRVVWLLGCLSIFPVNVGEIPLSSGKKS